jgi:hypothetical protein
VRLSSLDGREHNGAYMYMYANATIYATVQRHSIRHNTGDGYNYYVQVDYTFWPYTDHIYMECWVDAIIKCEQMIKNPVRARELL